MQNNEIIPADFPLWIPMLMRKQKAGYSIDYQLFCTLLSPYQGNGLLHTQLKGKLSDLFISSTCYCTFILPQHYGHLSNAAFCKAKQW